MYHISRATAMVAMISAATVISAGAANADAVNPAQSAPQSNPAAPADNAPQAAPVDPGAEYLKAFDGIAGTFSNDSTVGRVVGTAAGILVGCPVGAVTGGTLFIPVAPLTPVGIVGGCLIGAAALGFVGGTVGSVVSGSPATMNALNQQYQSLHSKGLIAAPVPVQNNAR